MVKLVLTLVVTIVLVSESVQLYTKKCDRLGVNFYELLGCTVVKKRSGCPLVYTCPKYKIADGNTCMVGGKELKYGEPIKNGTSRCLWCECGDAGYGGNSQQFPCATTRCYQPEVKIGCYLKQDLDVCCPQDEYCPDSSTSTCLSDRKRYKEFQMFEPEDTCLECVCKKGYVLYGEEYCKRTQCNLEVNDYRYLANECTPFYSNTKALCCPQGYICDDSVKEVSNVRNVPSAVGMNCVFKGTIYAFRSSFEVSFSYLDADYKVRCECKVAPYATCVLI